MKLSKEEVLEIALDFDNRVRRGMTIPEQIDFLVDNYATLADDYEIDKSAPGTLRDARDIFGNNALWYLFYRNESSSHPSDDEDATDTDRIETLLLEHGCDPDQPNCLELTYNAIKVARAILRDALWLCR